jgi:hypothetical protein
MQVLASVIVELAPIFLVVWWWPDRRESTRRRVGLDCLGAAFVAGGLCSYIGAKYFGLLVFGRQSVVMGQRATGAALFVSTLGAALFLLHYVFRAASPFARRFYAFAMKPMLFIRSRAAPANSATVADVPSIVAKLATLKDGSFAVFMFDSPTSSDGDAVNLQYSVERGAVGLDWVLLGQTNIADKERVAAFASRLGHPMTQRVMNDVHYLRTEGRDLDSLGTSIIVELYRIPRDAELDLVTEGFEWLPNT